MANSSIQQHEPLRVPERWTSQERRLIAQLEEIFDDIYRRFGRLRMQDMGAEVRQTLQSAKEVDGKLQDMESSFEQTAEGFRTEVSRVEKKADDAKTAADNAQSGVNEAKSSITQTAEAIKTEVSSVSKKADDAQKAADEAKSSITQTATDIRLEVSSVDKKADAAQKSADDAKTAADNAQTDADEAKNSADDIADGTTPVPKLQNSSVVIDTDGVALNGGTIIVKAGAKIIVQSGGAVQIDAKDGDNSYITLGDMFSATKDGGIVSDMASFSQLKVQGHDVLTDGSIGAKVVVSTSQPTDTGVLWFKPTATSSVQFSAATGADRNKWFSEGHPTNTVGLTPSSTDTLANGTLHYALDVPFYLVNESYEPHLHMVATASKASDGTQNVKFECDLPEMRAWEEKTVHIEVTSTVNLAADANAINLSVTLTGCQTFNTYIQKDRNITLKISNPDATESCMPCDVFYLP